LAQAKKRTSPNRRLQLVLGKKPERKLRVAVVIPAFNECLSLGPLLERLRAQASSWSAFEVYPVVVNDGSTDGTRELLDQRSAQWGAYALHLPVNLGIGKAVQTGFRFAVERLDPDVVLQLDGDGQHPAGAIPSLVGPVAEGGADVVVGSRYLPGAGGNVSSRWREWGTSFFSVLLRLLVGVRIRDTTSGFRAFSRRAAEFLARSYPDDYPEVQAYVPLARKGFRIREIAVTMAPRRRGRSSITPWGALYYMVKVAFATLMDRFRRLPS
jgi:hypothetical protein